MSDYEFDPIPTHLGKVLDANTLLSEGSTRIFSVDDLTKLVERVSASISADEMKGDTYTFYSRGYLADGSAIKDVVDDLAQTTNVIRESDIGFLLVDGTFQKSLTRTIEQELSASLNISVNEFTPEQNRVNLLLNGTDEFGNRVN